MTLQRSAFLVSLFCCIFLCGACKSSPPSPSPAPKEYISQGIIVATASRFLLESKDDPFEQFDVIAMFPKYLASQHPNIREILDTHVPQSDLTLDTCSIPEPQFLSGKDKKPTASISLLDAGDMFIETEFKKILIPTRTFPDLLKVIDGVIYSATPSHGIEFIPGQTYTLKNHGTDNIGSFEVVLAAPNDLGDITVGGIFPMEGIPVIGSRRPTQITWEGEEYGDEVIADINWIDMGLSWKMVCRMKDDGQFVIPSSITKQMSSELTEQTHEMRLSRVRQVSFAAPFISYGDFSFVASTSFLVEFDNIE